MLSKCSTTEPHQSTFLVSLREEGKVLTAHAIAELFSEAPASCFHSISIPLNVWMTLIPKRHCKPLNKLTWWKTIFHEASLDTRTSIFLIFLCPLVFLWVLAHCKPQLLTSYVGITVLAEFQPHQNRIQGTHFSDLTEAQTGLSGVCSS